MKINALPTNRPRQMSGFTLIEMIGVLAVIAILAAVLIPKVFEAINNARVSNAAMSVNSEKTACIDHYAKYGSFPVDGSSGTPVAIPTLPYDAFDTVLVKEGLSDKPFTVKIGDGTTGASGARVRLVAASPTAITIDAVNAALAAYNLSGATTPVDDTLGTWLVEAVITKVTVADARALNAAIDGTSAGMGEVGGKDFGGRVEYGAPASDGTVEVHIYLTHR